MNLKMLFTCAAFVSATLIPAASAFAESTTSPPKLIVVISVDQFSSNLFNQYRSRLPASGGLKRLTEKGVVFPNGYQSHAATETCPGHSTMLTGRHPSATGIIANEWLDADGKKVYCLADPSVNVPGRPGKGRSPANLRVSTLGEWLKNANAASRTVSVSGKDRGAINMAGHKPDAVFWWDDELGFNTYVSPGENEADRLAPVAEFNRTLAKAWAKKLPSWKPADKSCSALNSEGIYDSTVRISHRVPPQMTLKDVSKDGFRKDPVFKGWIRASPVIDRITLDLAGSLVKRYKLGRGVATDLLTISLSATDYVGHRYGNQGPEMCDQMAHLDRALGAFLKSIDALKVPYIVALTADHGAVDVAERMAQRGFSAERMTLDVAKEANTAVRAALNLSYDPFKDEAPGLYIQDKQMSADERARIAAAALDFLNGMPWVEKAFAKTEALKVQVKPGTPADELTLIERFAESVDAERSPDVLIAFKPYVTLGHIDAETPYIASHGSPWNYDRRVPIVFYRPGAKPFEQALPIETVDIAPTLAAIAGIPVPQTDGRCIDLDRGEASTCPSNNGP